MIVPLPVIGAVAAAEVLDEDSSEKCGVAQVPGAANTANLGVFCNSTDVGTISGLRCRGDTEGTVLLAG